MRLIETEKDRQFAKAHSRKYRIFVVDKITKLKSVVKEINCDPLDLFTELKILQRGYCEGSEKIEIGKMSIGVNSSGKMIEGIVAESSSDFFHLALKLKK